MVLMLEGAARDNAERAEAESARKKREERAAQRWGGGNGKRFLSLGRCPQWRNIMEDI